MNFIQTVEADGKKALEWVKTEATHLATEAGVLITWVEKEVPAAAPALGLFLQAAEADAAVLAKIAANGLGTSTSALLDDLQTVVLNYIESSGLSTNAKGTLKQLDVSAFALVNTVGQAAFRVALTQVLAKLPQLGVAVVAAAATAV